MSCHSHSLLFILATLQIDNLKKLRSQDVLSDLQETTWVVAIVQLLSHVWLFANPRTTAHQAPLSSTSSQSCSNSCPLSWWCHLTISSCHPLLILPSVFPSIRIFSSESTLCIRWPKYWSFSFSISPSSEYSGLISFRIDWFDLLAVQGTLKHLL